MNAEGVFQIRIMLSMGRIFARRVSKWVGSSLCFVIFFTWFLSRWVMAGINWPSPPGTGMLVVSSGRLTIGRIAGGWDPDASLRGLSLIRERRFWEWRFEHPDLSAYVPGQFELDVPLYIPFMCILSPTALLFFLDSRAGPGRCSRCGYSMSGLVHNAACPECGKRGSTTPSPTP